MQVATRRTCWQQPLLVLFISAVLTSSSPAAAHPSRDWWYYQPLFLSHHLAAPRKLTEQQAACPLSQSAMDSKTDMTMLATVRARCGELKCYTLMRMIACTCA